MTVQPSAAMNTEKLHAGIHTVPSLDPHLVAGLVYIPKK